MFENPPRAGGDTSDRPLDNGSHAIDDNALVMSTQRFDRVDIAQFPHSPMEIFAGATNTDASSATFNKVSGNQNITVLNGLPKSQDIRTILRPALQRGQYYVPRCMDGTRKNVFGEIDRWLSDFDAPNILLLTGSPGAGKSAIASSLISKLTKRCRLGSSFFFKRGDGVLGDPALLWRTVACDLAQHEPNFHKNLDEALRRKPIDPPRRDIKMHFNLLIKEPLKRSYNHVSNNEYPVIVIDAVDECDFDGLHEADRKALFKSFSKWSHLSGKFKLIITSRDDRKRIPESLRSLCKQLTLSTGKDVSDDTNRDIRHFFEIRFGELPGSGCLSDWPGERNLEKLTMRAAGLFVWAETVVKFMHQGLPNQQLELVLGGNLGGKDILTTLYQGILDVAFQNAKSPETLQMFRLVVSTIILAKTPLHVNDLHQLLSEPRVSVEYILDKLSTVISIGKADKLVCLDHLLFTEFLCDSQRCSREFYIDCAQESQNIALRCFHLMNNGLRFNICNLTTSYVFNDDVPDLDKKIEDNISGPLLYSCYFWAGHLLDIKWDQDTWSILQNEIKDFFYKNLLFWLEVMSLKKEVAAANISLLTVIPQIRKLDATLANFIQDFSQFIVTFDVPISESTPHIYVSALPFAPSGSLTAKIYRPYFPKTLSVISGGIDNWPAMMNIFRSNQVSFNCVKFSPDSQEIAAYSADGTIHCWNAITGQTIPSVFEKKTKAIFCATFSSDGKSVASCSADNKVYIQDAQTGQIRQFFEDQKGAVNCIALSPDGQKLAIGYSNIIQICDTIRGQIVVDALKNHKLKVRCLTFSVDGKRLASGFGNNVHIWDSVTGKAITNLLRGHADSVTSIAYSSDTDKLASGSVNCKIHIWDATSGQIISGPFTGHKSSINCIGFSKDDTKLVSGSSDYIIYIWNAVMGHIIAGPFTGHTSMITNVIFSPDGKKVASCSSDQTVRIWNASTSYVAPSHYINHIYNASCFAISPNGGLAVSGSWDGTIYIWDVWTGHTVAGPLVGHIAAVKCVTFSQNGKQFASCSLDKLICIWNTDTGQIVTGPLNGHNDTISGIRFSPDGKQVATCSFDSTVCIWNSKTGHTVSGLMNGHTPTANVTCIEFSPDGKYLASGSSDKTICIWDTAAGQIALDPLRGHASTIQCVGYLPSGKLISFSSDGNIFIWDGQTFKQFGNTTIANIWGDIVCNATFSSDCKQLALCHSSGMVSIWNIETGHAIERLFHARENCVAFLPGGKQVASNAYNYTICIWDIQNFSHSSSTIFDTSSIKSSWAYDFSRTNSWHAHDDLAIFWIPYFYQGGLCHQDIITIFGHHITRVDFSEMVHGTNWTQCYDQGGQGLSSSSPETPISDSSYSMSSYMCYLQNVLFFVVPLVGVYFS